MTPHRDPGLQPERTRLAWARTCLALCASALLGIRITLADSLIATACVAVALALAAGALLVSSNRARARRLHTLDGTLESAFLPALVAGATAALASAELIYLVCTSLTGR